MSRHIKFTNQDHQYILQKIESIIRTNKFQDGKLNFVYSLPSLDLKTNLVISSVAWTKILTLVTSFDKEVQWHGIVERTNDGFLIKDILLFPHEITSTTVTSDQKKYEEWLDSLDDNTFNHLRFHGHSHVNMAVHPSSVDMDYREKILQTISQNDDEAYYIFLIINKKCEISAEIYDVSNNILYETSDINFIIYLNEQETVNNFVNEAKTLATSPVIQTVTKQNKKKEKKSDYNYYNYDNYDRFDNPCDNCSEFDCDNCKKYLGY